MAEISFTVPNNQVSRMVDALCVIGGYAGDAEDQSARREFARGVVSEFIRQSVRQVEMRQAFMATQAATPVTDPLDVS